MRNIQNESLESVVLPGRIGEFLVTEAELTENAVNRAIDPLHHLDHHHFSKGTLATATTLERTTMQDQVDQLVKQLLNEVER